MKIGIVTNLYPPYARGGAENVIVRTVEQLLAMGHDIFLITGHPKNKGTNIKLGTSSIERVYRFFPQNIYFTIDDHKYRWPVRLLWHIIDTFSHSGADVVEKILADEHPDVVITHNLKGIGLRIPEAIQAMKIPHVHILHDLQLITPSGLRMLGEEKEQWYSKIGLAIYRAICRTRMGKPSMILSPSHFLIEEYTKAGFFKDADVRFMPNPSPKSPAAQRDARRSGPLRLLYAGQLGVHKGIVFLLNAFAKLDADVRLYVAGGGPLRAMVEERAAHDKRIIYLGYTAPEELLKVMVTVDAMVVPSLCYENSPTVIYEALSAGIPLIASNIGGVGELIVNHRTGLLFAPGDEEDFIRAVNSMNAQKDGFAGRTKEIQESIAPYELSKYAERLVEALTEAIAAQSRQ